MKKIMKISAVTILTVTCLIASPAFSDECTTPKCLTPGSQPTNPDLQMLQGIWKGVDISDPARQQITMTITNNFLHFHRDENFWFKTTITLPTDKMPKQLHATIRESADEGITGEVVGAIFKIENGILTLASYGSDSNTPSDDFSRYESRYIMKKNPPKNGTDQSDEESKVTPADIQELTPKADPTGFGILLLDPLKKE